MPKPHSNRRMRQPSDGVRAVEGETVVSERWRMVVWPAAVAVGVLASPPVSSAATVAGLTRAQIRTHDIGVTHWSLLTAFVGYHAVAGGHLGQITHNVRIFWQDVGSGNPGRQSLGRKVQELHLLLATARMADTEVALINQKGQAVAWQRYMKSPHKVYRFAVLNASNRHVLSVISVPWQDPTVTTVAKAAAPPPRPTSPHPPRSTARIPVMAHAWGALRLSRD